VESLDKNSPKANELGFDCLCPDLKTDVQQNVRREGIANFIVTNCFGEIQYGEHASLQSENSHPHFHDVHTLGSDEVSGLQWEKAVL